MAIVNLRNRFGWSYGLEFGKRPVHGLTGVTVSIRGAALLFSHEYGLSVSLWGRGWSRNVRLWR